VSNGLENFPKITGKDRRKVSSSCEGLLVIYRFFPLFKSIGIVASFQNIAVMRSNSAVVILASLKTCAHSPKLRLVVTIDVVFSY
jgi:hypothetical protein